MRAFSLVELSIVLVILGLLTGGILAGQSLIRAAEIRSIHAQMQQYMTAIQTFRGKYNALPGDMNNAQLFWGAATTCPGTSATPSTTAATCNGNSDGQIRASSTANEIYRSWQHLANAGLVEGSYTGVANSTTAWNSYALPGTNVPTGKLSNTGWNLVFRAETFAVSDTFYFDGNYGTGNLLEFGGAQPTVGSPSLPVLKPEEMWNFDTKADDGMPATGFIRSWEAWAGTCSSPSSSTTASLQSSTYLLTNTNIACSILIIAGY